MEKTFEEKSQSTNFLNKRMNLNENSLRDFDEWSINHLPNIPLNASLLDLGCGTGKQTKLFGDLLSSKSSIYSLDLSADSLKQLNEAYNSAASLVTINDSFENFKNHIPEDKKFDLIYSFYALYYTNDLSSLMEVIYKSLKKGGSFWVVCPYKGTNIEIFDMLKKYYELDEKVIYSIDLFPKDVVEKACEAGFSSVKYGSLKNKVFFNSQDKLISYLNNTTFYNREFEDEITKDIERVFIKNGQFQVSKNVISIQFVK